MTVGSKRLSKGVKEGRLSEWVVVLGGCHPVYPSVWRRLSCSFGGVVPQNSPLLLFVTGPTNANAQRGQRAAGSRRHTSAGILFGGSRRRFDDKLDLGFQSGILVLARSAF